MCQVEGHPVRAEVPPECGPARDPEGREALLLLPRARPLLAPLQLRPDPFPAGFHLGNRRPFARPPPVAQEAQELEGAVRLAAPGCLCGAGEQPRLLLMEPQTICGEPLAQRTQHTLRIPRLLAPYPRIVRIAIEGDLPSTMGFAHFCKPCIEHVMSKDMGENRAALTPYKVANMLVEFSTSMPRTQLRPGYGDGFLGAPLQRRQALENPTLREQGEPGGSSTTPSQQHSGGAPPL